MMMMMMSETYKDGVPRTNIPPVSTVYTSIIRYYTHTHTHTRVRTHAHSYENDVHVYNTLLPQNPRKNSIHVRYLYTVKNEKQIADNGNSKNVEHLLLIL